MINKERKIILQIIFINNLNNKSEYLLKRQNQIRQEQQDQIKHINELFSIKTFLEKINQFFS